MRWLHLTNGYRHRTSRSYRSPCYLPGARPCFVPQVGRWGESISSVSVSQRVTEAVKRNERGRVVWTANRMIPRTATTVTDAAIRSAIQGRLLQKP